MTEFPQLTTERLILNRPVLSDKKEVMELMNDQEISENTHTIPYPYKEENADFWFTLIEDGFSKKNAFIFAIRKKEDLQLIGAVGLHCVENQQRAEAGYWIGKDFRNQGFVTEALQAVLDFGFQELKLHKIFASHFSHNPQSGKVLLKCGMSQEGIQREHILKNGKFLDLVNYGILKQEFLHNR